MNIRKGMKLPLPKNADGMPPLPGGIHPDKIFVGNVPEKGLIDLALHRNGARGRNEIVIISATREIVEDLLSQ